MSTKLIRDGDNISIVPGNCSNYKQAMDGGLPRVQLVRREKSETFFLCGYGKVDKSHYVGNEANAIRIARHRVQNALDK